MIRRLLCALLLGGALLSETGCAGAVESWIVRTRDAQGDRALQRGNLHDAALAYKLALDVSPADRHARAGAVAVQLSLAQGAYRNGKLEEAFAELDVAERIEPKNPYVVDLREQLSEARLKREIVLSNYPTYKASAQEIVRAYIQLRTVDQQIIASLRRFGYTYDTIDLNKAIDGSSLLGAEVAKNTARLVQFRQAVESGATAESPGQALAPPSSLLPLP
ncbi:MAG: hypothetical protein JO359_03450 [Candidatus Eremiobacteraeota bacterium]|nr:hypothetical protein [Candidatus Eremiobacteraeota bacterium]